MFQNRDVCSSGNEVVVLSQCRPNTPRACRIINTGLNDEAIILWVRLMLDEV